MSHSDTDMNIPKKSLTRYYNIKRCEIDLHTQPYMYEHKKFLGCYCKNGRVYEFWVTMFKPYPQKNIKKHEDNAETESMYLKDKEEKKHKLLSSIEPYYSYIWHNWKREHEHKTYLYLSLVYLDLYSNRFCCY